MTDIQAVLLDMGGVILHMAHAHGFPVDRLDWRGRQAMLERMRSAGGKATLEDLERWVFAPWRARYESRQESGKEASWSPHLERLRQKAGIETPDFDLLRAWFRPYGERLEPLEGAATALRELESMNVGLALVSNVPLPGALYREILERYGLLSCFDNCLFSYDCGSRKPSPAMLRRALAAMAAKPGSAVMVGDRRDRDIAAGRSAGVQTVWIESEDGGGPNPDFTIGTLAELPELLRVRSES